MVGGIRVINPIHCGRQTGQTGKLKVFVYVVISPHCSEKCRAGEEDNQAIKSHIVDTTVVFSPVIVHYLKYSTVLWNSTQVFYYLEMKHFLPAAV